MKTAVIGLGLIGGSMAKAFKDNTDSEVYGLDINASVMLKAKLVGAIDGELTDDILAQCDRVIIALYPESTVEFLQSKADMIKKGAVVIDCSGVKRYVFTPPMSLQKPTALNSSADTRWRASRDGGLTARSACCSTTLR